MSSPSLDHVVIVGPGQLGRLFGGGALALGARVTPIRRGDDVGAALRRIPSESPVWICVPEASLAGVAEALPASRRARAICVQNNLFAPQLEQFGFDDATIVSVWTNAKSGQPMLVGRRSGVYGPLAAHVTAAHKAVDLPCVALDTIEARDTELVAKYAFILAVNGLGLVSGGTVADVTTADPARTTQVVGEALALGAMLCGGDVDLADASAGVADAVHGFAAMPARGRSSATRVLMAHRAARDLGIDAPAISALAALASG